MAYPIGPRKSAGIWFTFLPVFYIQISFMFKKLFVCLLTTRFNLVFCFTSMASALEGDVSLIIKQTFVAIGKCSNLVHDQTLKVGKRKVVKNIDDVT
jgi:hypothetical protein